MTAAAIRRASSADLEPLLPLVRGYREFYGRAHDALRERSYLAMLLQQSRSEIIVAWIGDRAVGFTQLFPTFSTTALAPSLILEDLYVAPDARGGGIATALLRAACDYARSVGAAGMFLETAVDNTTAQRVYERNGWTREGRFLKYNAPA